MIKSDVLSLVERYGMDILFNNAVECVPCGYYCLSSGLLPELDVICDDNDCRSNVVVTRQLFGDEYLYRLYCPDFCF